MDRGTQNQIFASVQQYCLKREHIILCSEYVCNFPINSENRFYYLTVRRYSRAVLVGLVVQSQDHHHPDRV